MKPLAKYPSRMQPSGIREVMRLARDVPGVIHLEVGEPSFPTPEHIVEAAVKAARDGFTRYSPNAGIASLREACAEKLRSSNKIQASLEDVTVTPGSVWAVASSLMALMEVGDEILIPDPGWPNYEMMVVSNGGVPKRYPLLHAEGFLPDFDALEGLVSRRTKALLINSPSNPTGSVFPRDTVEGLVAFAAKHDLYVIADEVYEKLVYEGEHISPGLFDEDGRVISVFGFSKTYAMTGWRVGYVHAPREISALIQKLQEPNVSCSCTVSQYAAEAALRGPQDCVALMREAYRRRRDLAVEILKDRGFHSYSPQGAFYIMVDISSGGMESLAFSREVLRKRRVAVAPGEAFGDVGRSCVRVALAAAEEDVAEGLKRICDSASRPPSQESELSRRGREVWRSR